MADPQKLEKIGKLLKAEEERFMDYREIEERTTALGFPISIRTLRFYINEGVLPPPKKIGKTPVYEEDWILNVLLAVHLMKTRFHRSLSEIRAILQNLNEDPSILADKCSVLYSEYVRGESLSRLESEWLAEAFFGEITGKRRSYRPGEEEEENAGKPKQPGAVIILDLVKDMEENGEWRTGTGGERASLGESSFTSTTSRTRVCSSWTVTRGASP